MVIPILIGAALIVVVLVAVVAMQPADFQISRSRSMKAPAAVPFGLVNDHHHWERWSPWEKLDPNSKKTYEGPDAGPGAIYRWSGNNKVGEGCNTITENRPNELIRMKLEFVRPFQCTNAVEFTFQPQQDETVVTWTMTGKNNFMGKAFGLIMNMDKIVGGEFENGLTTLSTIVEGKGS